MTWPTAPYSPARAAKLAHLSQIVYSANAAELAKSLGFKNAHLLRAGTCHALVALDGEGVSIAFRGTEPTVLQDLLADAQACLVLGAYGRVHEGFRRFYTAIRADLLGLVQPAARASLWITGHSLGGSLALLAAAMDFPAAEVYAFAPARVGDATFADLFDSARTWSFIRECDPVPRLAPLHWGYADVATRVYLTGGKIAQVDTTLPTRLGLDVENLLHWRGLFADHGIAAYRADLDALAR